MQYNKKNRKNTVSPWQHMKQQLIFRISVNFQENIVPV